MELKLDAVIENVPKVVDWVEEQLEEYDCPPKVQMQISVSIDEVFTNIASYAYANGVGQATVRLDVLQDPACVRLTFLDSGIPFDPLAKKDPDVSLSIEERQIGGLGIFMVKKLMDDVQYEYRDGKNILTLYKKL